MITFIIASVAIPELTDELINFSNHNAHHQGQMATYLGMLDIKYPDFVKEKL